MLISISINGVPIRLTDERWAHIVRGHPEMAGLLDEVMTTIQEPDLVQLGDAGELLALRLSPSRVPRYVVSVYREVSEADGFVITAYVTRQPNRRRKTLWTP